MIIDKKRLQETAEAVEQGLASVKKLMADVDLMTWFADDFALRFCWSSNAIEGNTLSLDETVALVEYDEVRAGHTYSEYHDAKNLSADLIVRPQRNMQAVVDPKVQRMIDDICIASGRRPPSEIAAEKRLQRLSERSKGQGEYKDLQSVINAAEALRGGQRPEGEKTIPRPPNVHDRE